MQYFPRTGATVHPRRLRNTAPQRRIFARFAAYDIGMGIANVSACAG
jgi:hypothetical protein